MPDPIDQLDRLAAKQTKLSGDTPFKYDQSRCDLVDSNEDRRMHWWSERDDEFYAMCRNLDFSALAAHIRQVEAERDYLNTTLHTCSDDCSRLHCVQRREIAALRTRLAEAEAIVIAMADAVVLYGDDREPDPEAGEPVAVEFPHEDGAFWWGCEELALALHNLRTRHAAEQAAAKEGE